MEPIPPDVLEHIRKEYPETVLEPNTMGLVDAKRPCVGCGKKASNTRVTEKEAT